MFHIFMLFTPVSFWKFYCPSIGASNSSSHRHCLLFHTSSSHPSLFKLLSYIAVIFSEHSYLVFKLTNYFSMRSHCIYIKCYFLFHWFFFFILKIFKWLFLQATWFFGFCPVVLTISPFSCYFCLIEAPK